MITLRIWLRWNTNTAALEKLGIHVEESRHGRLSVHITHPHCSPLIRLLPEEAVEEVELHDYSVDESVIADGTRTSDNTVLCAISAEAMWLDGKMRLIQHVVARGRSICDVMELYFIALQEADIANTRQPA